MYTTEIIIYQNSLISLHNHLIYLLHRPIHTLYPLLQIYMIKYQGCSSTSVWKFNFSSFPVSGCVFYSYSVRTSLCSVNIISVDQPFLYCCDKNVYLKYKSYFAFLPSTLIPNRMTICLYDAWP